MNQHNGLLAIASRGLIHRNWEMTEGRNPTGVYFHKIMFLLNKNLQGKGIELKFPYFWYLYGPIAVRRTMDSIGIRFNHETEWHTDVRFASSLPPIEGDFETARSAINEELSSIMEYYPPDNDKESLHTLIEDVYNYAPFDFQRFFRGLKLLFGDIEYSPIEIEGVEKLIKDKLMEIRDSFPKNEFFTLIGRYELTIEAAIIALNEFPPLLDLAQDMVEKFWAIFCKFLRVHPDASENITGNMIKWWKHILPTQLDEFDKTFASQLDSMNQKSYKLWSEALKSYFRWVSTPVSEREKSSRELADIFSE